VRRRIAWLSLESEIEGALKRSGKQKGASFGITTEEGELILEEK
jgi:hypothetical protein